MLMPLFIDSVILDNLLNTSVPTVFNLEKKGIVISITKGSFEY